MLAIVPPWRMPRRFWGGILSWDFMERREDCFGGVKTYGVLLLHSEFEIDGVASGFSYFELWKRWISHSSDVDSMKGFEYISNTLLYCKP